MTDLENREAFEKWFKKAMYHKHLKENFWDAWNASTQRQGFKLVPLGDANVNEAYKLNRLG